MARGWESKSVEEQQSQAVSISGEAKPRLSEKQRSDKVKLEGLLLSRRRVVRQLETSQNPQLRSMLESALTDLDQRLKQGQ